jgi:hypothetical protein
MDRLVRIGSVAGSYLLGWTRSIAEVFAEDYAQLALPGTRFEIPWLAPPDETVLAALKADLGLGPEPTIAEPPPIKPVTISRRGKLVPRGRATIDFGLLGPGRRVQATATVAGAQEKRPRATLEIRCGRNRVATARVGAGTTRVSLDRRNVGPGDCTATLTSTSTSRRAYTLVVRLIAPA